MHRGHCRQGVHLSLLGSWRTFESTHQTHHSWHHPILRCSRMERLREATELPLGPEQESGFPIPQQSHWPGRLPGRSESQSTLHRAVLGKNPQASSQSPSSLSPSWDINAASTLTLNYKPKGTLCTSKPVLCAERLRQVSTYRFLHVKRHQSAHRLPSQSSSSVLSYDSFRTFPYDFFSGD